MADETRAPEGSVKSTSLSHEGASRVTSFPLEVDRSRNRTKLKWLGSLGLLKTFALDHLKLMGSWSFTSNNGGFHFLKSECVTLSFYPSTKTLNVQGMKEKEMRDKMLSLATEEADEFAPLVDDYVNQDGGDVEGNQDDYEEEDVISQGEQGSANAKNATTLPITEMHCCCDKNTAAIHELSSKFDALEAKMEQLRPQLSPSYEELLAKVKTLEDERDSLLTALRLLKEDFSETVNDHRINNTQQGDSDMEWQEVTRGRSRKLFKDGQLNCDENNNNNRNDNRGDRNRNRNRHANSDGNAAQYKEKVLIVGDSMTKFIKPNKLSKKHHVQSYSFAGAKVEDMNDFVKPLLRRRPDKVIVHVGTNNVKDDNPKRVKGKIAELVDTIRNEQPNAKIVLSSVIHRNDDRSLNGSIDQVNRAVESVCRQRGLDFISHDNIPEDCLNNGGLHLNRKGVYNLANNFRKYLSSSNN